MKSNSVLSKQGRLHTAMKSFVSPVLIAGTLAAALPLTADAQARGARPSYSAPSYSPPSYSPPVSRPSSAPSYSRPSYSPSPSPTMPSGSPGSIRPGFPTSSLSNGLNSRTGTDFNMLFQRNNPPADGRTALQQGRMPSTPLPGRITQSNPGTINNLIGNGSNSSYNRFNNTAEAHRHYGVPYQGGRYYYGGYGGFNYFPGSLAYYPYYSPFYSYGYSGLSPYAFYYGAFPPFISLGSVYSAPPQYVYVPYPVYQDGNYNGYRNEDIDGYYLNQRNPNQNGGDYRIGEGTPKAVKDAALDAAIADIQESWKSGKLDPLAKHVRRDARVAVYLRGKYQYSLEAGDYLDLTRDALNATKTVRFTLDNVQRKQKDIVTVTGRHLYRDKDNKEHTVFVTYVLEKADGDYVITQVGSAPEKVEEQ